MRITEKKLRTIIRQVISETISLEMTPAEKDDAVKAEVRRINYMMQDALSDNYHLHGVSGAPQEDLENIKQTELIKFYNKSGITPEEFDYICTKVGCSFNQ